MTVFCPSCKAPSRNEAALAAHVQFKHKGGDPVVVDQPTVGKVRKSPAPVKAPKVTKNGVKPAAKLAKAIEAQAASPTLAPPLPKVIDEPELVTALAAEAADRPRVYTTREEWMQAAVEMMRPRIEEAGYPVGPVRISFGWAGGRGKKVGVRGQCWMPVAVSDGVPTIFVTPDNETEKIVTILGIILHEMNHAAGNGGHTGSFVKAAKALGFEKPWTSSEGKNEELQAYLEDIAERLGPLDHGRINQGLGLLGKGGAGGPPVQSTRMLKVQCVDCECIIRMTQKWIDAAGTPTCGCGGAMLHEEVAL